MRKAKIVCTIGPVTSGERQLKALIENGMNAARLNFSHGDHKTHGEIIERIRRVSRQLKKKVAILQDLQGIKIRTGKLKGEKVQLKKGDELVILKGDETGDEKRIFIDFPWLIENAKSGDVILLDDGLIKLGVTKKGGESLNATVIEGGVLKEHKGVNLPHMKIRASAFTEKDKKDLEFGIKMEVDFVALSFVRTISDVNDVKRWLSKKGASLPIIAKIEKEEAIKNIDKILDEVDGIMVARGDLGVEMPLEEVPILQKMLIDKANKKRRIVITATQMLESMTAHSRPTRAESTDVANAVIDGTDALMLSEETSAGRFPIDAVEAMGRIITFTEESMFSHPLFTGKNDEFDPGFIDVPEAVAHAASWAAKDTGAKRIVAFTRTGFTARLLSKFRPDAPIIAFSTDEKVVSQMALYWGVESYLLGHIENTDDLVKEVDTMLVKLGYGNPGDKVVIVAGLPLWEYGRTNLMKVHTLAG